MTQPYIHGYHTSVLRGHSWRTVENSCPHLLPHLQDASASASSSPPPIKILDVGCGPGSISIDLATRVPQGSVHAFDLEPGVIEQARRRAEEQGVTNVHFEVGDIFHWQHVPQVEEASFDIVHAHQVLQHLANPLHAIQQMKRLVRPGGILALRDCDWPSLSWWPEHAGIQKWHDLYTTVSRSLACRPDMGRQLHALALQAGFARHDIDATVSAWTFSTPQERRFWCGQWADRTTMSAFSARAVESGCADDDDLASIVSAFRDMQEKEEAWFAVIHGEVICRVK